MSKAPNRCPNCDSVVTKEQTVCVMCGTAVSPPSSPAVPSPPSIAQLQEETSTVETAPDEDVEPPRLSRAQPSGVMKTVLRERSAPWLLVVTGLFIFALLIVGFLIVRYQEPVAVAQVVQTGTAVAPAVTMTPTETAVFTETPAPTQTPTITPTAAPTETARPPRIHVVASGDTLIGLSFVYRVSPESIAETNGFALDTQVQVNQNLLIPWPTATPPLEVMSFEVNGTTVVLDPRGCEQIEVQSGESLVAIASRYGINFEWLAEINRITSPDLMQPGDVVCIPKVLYDSEGVLPPTPGPSPTPTATSLPAGPQLLFPANGAHFDLADEPIVLQWLAVQNLNADEQYMVELVDENDIDGAILRAFTTNTTFQLPTHWRPIVDEMHQFRWQVSIVKVTDVRSDGVPIYTLGGKSSAPSIFTWQGIVPSPTPSPTNTAVPTSTPTPQPDS